MKNKVLKSGKALLFLVLMGPVLSALSSSAVAQEPNPQVVALKQILAESEANPGGPVNRFGCF